MTTPSAAARPLSESDDRLWGSLAHFGDLLGFLPALLILLILKDRGPVVRRESTTALNWAITVAIAFVVLQILSALLARVPVLGALLALLLFALAIVNIVFAILNGVRVSRGEAGRYPFSLQLVRQRA